MAPSFRGQGSMHSTVSSAFLRLLRSWPRLPGVTCPVSRLCAPSHDQSKWTSPHSSASHARLADPGAAPGHRGFVSLSQDVATGVRGSSASRPVRGAVAAANQARVVPRWFLSDKSGRSRAVKVVSKVSVAPTSAAVTAGEFNFQEYMMGRADDVNTALDQSLPMAYPESVHESMRYSLLAGGKRIRPMLCVAAFELFASRMDTVMPTACALEMIHTMTLMHDDLPCMDNDDFRRGVPTNHKVYGEEVAILAGDALLTYAFEYIAEKTPTEGDGCADPRTVLKVLSYIGRKVGSTGLVGGQIVDIEMEGRSEEASLETLQYIHAKKTADLLDAAVVCGAMLGGAGEEDVARLTKYSQNIGLAFQVVDDILDCTMSSEELGKTAGKDEAVGKTTYPSLLGLDESRRIAQKLIDDAKAELSPYDQAKAAPLLALADYIGNRQN